jgi:hypothetical protein
MSLNRRKLGHLMSSRFSLCDDFPRRLWQFFTAVPAMGRQPYLNGIDRRAGNQAPMMARVSWLASGFPPALVLSPACSRLASQPVGGWRLGGVGRILFARGQLSLQIRDLLFRIAELLFGLGQALVALDQLLPQLLVLAPHSLDFTFERPIPSPL